MDDYDFTQEEKSIGSVQHMTMPDLSRFKVATKHDPHIHSELHALVDETRKRFGETAKKGPGSFGFYLGFFKRLGMERVRLLLAQVRDSREPKKLFWFLAGKDAKKHE